MSEIFTVTPTDSQEAVGKTAVLRSGQRRKVTAVTPLAGCTRPETQFVLLDFGGKRRKTRGNEYGFLYLSGYENADRQECPSEVIALEEE